MEKAIRKEISEFVLMGSLSGIRLESVGIITKNINVFTNIFSLLLK